MKLNHSVVIHAPPLRVWDALVDPSHWSDWNPQLVHVVRTQTGPLEVGEILAADFVFNGRTTPSQIKVRVLHPHRHFTIKQRPEGRHRAKAVKIEYELEAEGEHTRVTETLDLKDAGLSFFGGLALWFGHRFGGGKLGALPRLKQRLEAAPAAPTAVAAAPPVTPPASPGE